LRILVITQTLLVLSGKLTKQPHVRLIIDSILKLGIGAFLYFFFLFNTFPGLDPWDAFIIRFSGVVIMLNVDYGGLVDILGTYSPKLSHDLGFLKAIQRAQHP
jgi:hypothetical protein